MMPFKINGDAIEYYGTLVGYLVAPEGTIREEVVETLEGIEHEKRED